MPAVARLLADGTLDPAFAGGGLLIARGAYGGLPGGWKSVAVAGPSIVLAGAVDGAPPFGTSLGRIAVVARITDSGRPDAAFAAGGFLQVPIDGVTFASTHAVAIDRRGRIVLGIWRATTVAFPGRRGCRSRPHHRGGPPGRHIREWRPGRARAAPGARAGGERHGHGRDPRGRRMVCADRRPSRVAARLRPSGRLDATLRRERAAVGRRLAGGRRPRLPWRRPPGGRRRHPAIRPGWTARPHIPGSGRPTRRGRCDERGLRSRLARARPGRVARALGHGCGRADHDRRVDPDRRHGHRRRARARALPGRRFDATDRDAHVLRRLRPRDRRGAGRPRGPRCPARPPGHRAHRWKRAARPGTAAASARIACAGPPPGWSRCRSCAARSGRRLSAPGASSCAPSRSTARATARGSPCAASAVSSPSRAGARPAS